MKNNTSVIKFALAIFAIVFSWSFLMYSFTNVDRAFSRLVASLLCVGLYVIILQLEGINNKLK
jgi:hypothetical protein